MRLLLPCLAALFLAGCRSSDNTAEDALRTMQVTLPSGRQIRAELMISDVDQRRGMMFRDDLPAGRGLLFIYNEPNAATFWMYQVKVPLDIVFLDSARRVLGVSADTPPCTTRSSDCPQYGGYQGTRYVLEMRAGEAARNGVKPGTSLIF